MEYWIAHIKELTMNISSLSTAYMFYGIIHFTYLGVNIEIQGILSE